MEWKGGEVQGTKLVGRLGRLKDNTFRGSQWVNYIRT